MIRILIGLCIIGAALSETIWPGSVPMPDGRIVGGEDADIRDYPHQISMRYKGNHRCGGSVIARHLILSAAHCVVGLDNADNLTITAGSTYLNPKSQELPVREFIVHNNYKTFNNDYDVAILVLDGEFELNESVKIIELADERPEPGTTVTVSGWGVLEENGKIPNTLQKVEVNVVDNAECKKAYSIFLTSRMLCAAVTGGGKDACQGDSGGPLIHGNKLLGVVSWGTGCARPSFPGVYASVPNLLEWIIATRDKYARVGSIDFL